MSATILPGGQTTMNIPAAMPTPTSPHPKSTVHLVACDRVKDRLAEITRSLLRLLAGGNVQFAMSAEFRRVVSLSQKLLDDIESSIPMPVRKKARGSLEEIIEFCASLKPPLPRSDAEWFFYKAEGNGWKNAGKPIVDWKATIRAWERAHYMPSQKVMDPRTGRTAGQTKTLNQQEIEKIAKHTERICND